MRDQGMLRGGRMRGHPYLGGRAGRRGPGTAAGRAAGAAARRRARTPWRPRAGQGGGGRRASPLRAPPFNGGGPGCGEGRRQAAGYWPGLPRPPGAGGGRAVPSGGRGGAWPGGGREGSEPSGARVGKDRRRWGCLSPGGAGDVAELQRNLHLSGSRMEPAPCEGPWKLKRV